MMRICAFAILLSLFLCSADAAERSTEEVSFLKSMLADSAAVSYRDESDGLLTFEQFVDLVTAGKVFDKEMNHDQLRVVFKISDTPISKSHEPKPRFNASSNLPNYSLADASGKPSSNADLRGRYSLLNFFFGGCVPCIQEIPVLNAYAESKGGVNLVGVTFDNQEDTRAFLSAHPFSWRVLVDAQSLIDAMGVPMYPMFALVDPDGRVIEMATSATIAGGERKTLTQATLAAWVDRKTNSGVGHAAGD